MMNNHHHHLAFLAMLGLIVLGLIVGCDQSPTPAPTAPPTATTRPSSTPSPTSSSTPSPTSSPAPSLTPTPSLTPSPTPSPIPPTPEPGPLPRLLTQIPLAPSDESLDDLLLDRAANRLYVTDTAGQLHVLDAATYASLTTLSAAGKLVLDSSNQRLYVSPRDNAGEVTIVDTGSLTIVGTVSPSGYVAVDGARRRFYVGNQVSSRTPEDAPGVRVYDGVTLEKLGEAPQPGIPVYNSRRDELYIVAYTVYPVNPDTLAVTGDLLPDITAQSLAWCNGCRMATNAHVFPERNLLVVEMRVLSAGKGPGMRPQPRYFDATTLAELTDLAQLPALEYVCDTHAVLVEPVDGRVYRGQNYSRYEFFNNLLVYDQESKLVTWRDGLLLGVTNPNTRQMYISYPLGTLVLDLTTLSPLGAFPAYCFHTLDAEAGRIYAFHDNNLVVFSQSGGEPELLPPIRVTEALTAPIQFIQPSPTYDQDHTLFICRENRFYRSRDGGQSWEMLRGGLPPTDDWWTRGLSISPDFAHDHTLFAYGYRADAWGDGVYRSTDGGDTWQPMWNGLTHLRVYDVVLSPDYAADGTLLAYARYQRIDPWAGGYSVFRSTDRGLHWTLALTRTFDEGPPAPASLLPAIAEPDTRFQSTFVQGNSVVQRSTDGGRTWETVLTLPSEAYTGIQAVLPSPDFATDRTVYVLHYYGLLRSTDGGETWQSWADERLAGRDYKNELTVLALSPSLADGRRQLFIGTAAGEFWVLDPTAMIWEPLSTDSGAPQ